MGTRECGAAEGAGVMLAARDVDDAGVGAREAASVALFAALPDRD
jgi:hypothetical protein